MGDDMLKNLVPNHSGDFYYIAGLKTASPAVAASVVQEVPEVNSNWDIAKAKDYNPSMCSNELRGARLSECEIYAEDNGYSAFTADLNNNFCFKDGDIEDMLANLVPNHNGDFHYTR